MEATDAAVAIERSAVARFALEYWRAAAAAAAFDRRTAVLPLQIKLLLGITSQKHIGKKNMQEQRTPVLKIFILNVARCVPDDNGVAIIALGDGSSGSQSSGADRPGSEGCGCR